MNNTASERITDERAKTLSDRVCDAATPLLFAKDGSQVGELVEAALECADALLQMAGERRS